jgi:hypothetical protein
VSQRSFRQKSSRNFKIVVHKPSQTKPEIEKELSLNSFMTVSLCSGTILSEIYGKSTKILRKLFQQNRLSACIERNKEVLHERKDVSHRNSSVRNKAKKISHVENNDLLRHRKEFTKD